MEYFAILLLCFVGISSALDTDCPRPIPWKQLRRDNKCYWFQDGDYLPQYKADERCRRYDAKLVKIDDQKENDWILANVIPEAKDMIGGGDSSHFYTGLKRTGSNENNWYWEVDGSPMDWGGNWKDGEPNNYHNKENCVTFYQVDGKWNDVMCGDSFHFICEYEIPPASGL